MTSPIGMFTKQDAKWVKQNRKETTANRTTPIVLRGKSEVGRHPITDEPVVEDVTVDSKAIVTELTSAFKTDISLDGGIMVEKGDLWIVVDMDDMHIPQDDVVDVKYRDKWYKVVAADAQGLGQLNRVIIVGRKVS